MSDAGPLQLLQWRRAVAALYAEVRGDRGQGDRGQGDPEQAWARWCQGRDALFATHPQSPLEAVSGFTGLPVAPYDPALRFTVALQATEPQRLDVATSDGTVPLDRAGRVELPLGSLDVWWVGVYGGGLFVPFADASNGDTTYGGGRYLLDTVKGADLGGDDGTLVLDLNFAYHPSCRYSARWSCPLAPPGNRLPVRVDAGELLEHRAAG